MKPVNLEHQHAAADELESWGKLFLAQKAAQTLSTQEAIVMADDCDDDRKQDGATVSDRSLRR